MKLHVDRWEGGDKVAVLVHGLFSDRRCWHRLAPQLVARGYSVVAPDLRGHGLSPRARYTTADWALDLVTTLPTEPDLAIGHSLGGLALALAAEPLGASRAVYLDPAWKITPAQDEAFRAEWREWLTWTSIEQLRSRLGGRWSEDDLELRWESMWRTDPEVVPGLAAGGGYDWSPEAPTMPSLVVAADPSEFITDAHALDLTERGIAVRRVPASGHSLFREDLDALLAVLDEWIP